MVELVIPGDPVGKGRPRYTRKGIAFTPKKTRNHEAYIRALFAHEYPKHEPMEGPLEMEVTVGFPIPKSASQKRRTDMLWGRECPTKRPDIDNLVKAFADALNGLAYRDDSQIVTALVQKYYSRQPRVEITIEGKP